MAGKVLERGIDVLIDYVVEEEMPENQGHLYDNTNKSLDEEIAEISSNIENYLVQ